MKIFLKIIIPIVCIVILVTFVSIGLTVYIFQSAYLENTAREIGINAFEEFSEIDDYLDVAPAGEKYRLFREYVNDIKSNSIFRVNIYDESLKVIYSDLKSNIGKENTENQNFKNHLKSDDIVHWLSIDNNNQQQPGFGEYIQIHTLVETKEGQAFLVEQLSDQSVVMSRISSAINYSGLIGFLALIAMIGSFYIILRVVLINPLQKLKWFIENISTENFDHKIVNKNNDEISDIGNSFNLMIDKVRQYQESLKIHENKLMELYKTEKMQNENLKKTKLTLMKVIENSTQISKQLEIEKANVEIKVNQRTEELLEKTKSLEKAKEEISSNWIRLQEEKARLTSSINSLPYGFLLTDYEGTIISFNNTLKSMINIKTEIVNVDDIQRELGGKYGFKDELFNTIKTGKKSKDIELSVREKYLTVSIFPIISQPEQKTIGAVMLIQDVTEQKVLERSRDEFFSIASHELRTPLTAIRGNTSLIKEYFAGEIKDPQLLEMINDIYDSSTRLIEIVNDFLDVSRLEQKRIEFQHEEFDIADLIEKVIDELKGVIDAKGIYAKMDHTLQIHPKIYADKNRTKQILYNIIGNASKFTDNGGITINANQKGDFLEIRIIDTGKGISDQSKSLLFRKFQQASNNTLTRDSTRGTGMGLYISRLLAQGMGGDVILEKSEENLGSTFLITLPTTKQISNTTGIKINPRVN